MLCYPRWTSVRDRGGCTTSTAFRYLILWSSFDTNSNWHDNYIGQLMLIYRILIYKTFWSMTFIVSLLSESQKKKKRYHLYLFFDCLHLIHGVLSLLDCLSEGNWLVYSVHTLGADWGQWPVSAHSIPGQVWSRGWVLQGLQVKDGQHVGQCQKVVTLEAQEFLSL